MVIHATKFVYGENIRHENQDGRFLVKGCDSTMELKVGDEIVWANKTPCQAWIETGVITELGCLSPSHIKIGTSILVNVEGVCYIGII